MRKIGSLPLACLLILVFLLGLAAGGWKAGANTAEGQETYDYRRTFVEALEALKEHYVDDVKEKDLIYASIESMVESLDPHSEFLTPDRYREAETEMKGEFGGIGLEVDVTGGFPTVVATMDGTPASRAGLRPGDRIVRIDGVPTGGMSLDDVVDRLRGRKGTRVMLGVTREGFAQPMELPMVRDIIRMKSVTFRMLEEGYGYIRIVEFTEQTGEDLKAAVDVLRKSRALKGILLDLRGNPGGLLEQAANVADRFLPPHLLITYTKGRVEEENIRFFSRSEDAYLGPLVVLVNGKSASASEVVAGTLQDRRRAIIVGARTFGKGSVQSTFPLNDGCALRLTTSRYYTPSGHSIQADGIHPDLVVEDDVERKGREGQGQENGTPNSDDFQLVMGIRVLGNWAVLKGE
jgi:carboxyl-terminal processing protease